MYEYTWDLFEFDGMCGCIENDVDSFYQYIDIDGDGYAETRVSFVDSDGDGFLDTKVVETDTNKDGFFNQMELNQDLNGDGYLETQTIIIDTNHNGIADVVCTVQDANGDGIPDQVIKSYDDDENGDADRTKVYIDVDNDGRFDVVYNYHDDVVEITTYDDNGELQSATYQIDPNTGEILFYGDIGDYEWIADGVGSNYDPANSDPTKVIGDPEVSMTHWEFQGRTNRCALFSQLFVIEELTGQEIDIEEFADFAKQNGWFTEENGTPFLNMDKMLTAYDIEHEMSYNNTIEDIERCLSEGGKVIVSVDANEIWCGGQNDVFSPLSGANHAVEVIGIDYSNPEHPMVILNDSGPQNGCGEMVPLDQFLDAWQDGDNLMIECYK